MPDLKISELTTDAGLNLASEVPTIRASGNWRNSLADIEGLFAAGTVLQPRLVDGSGNPVVPDAAGNAIKIGTPDASVYAWRDVIGVVQPRVGGAGAPTLAALYAGANIQASFFGAGESADLVYHIPHDYVPGTDLHVHVHWTHNGTALTGTLAATFHVTYARGFGQDVFPAEKSPTLSLPGLSIVSAPTLGHRTDEVQLSTSGGGATQLDSDLIEPDGLILLHFEVDTIPSISGGSQNQPAILHIDLHYQTSNIGTLDKAPPFHG